MAPAPQMQMVVSPTIATPVIYQQAEPPWAMETPEPSPMLWDRVPPSERHGNGDSELKAKFDAQLCANIARNFVPTAATAGKLGANIAHNLGPAAKAVDKEFLRTVCEPYFEEMLEAVYQAVLAHDFQMPSGQCSQSAAASMNQQRQPQYQQREPSTEFGSEGSEVGGAFSCIFSAPTGDGSEVSDRGGAFANVFACPTEEVELHGQELESEVGNGSVRGDKEKNIMVCRHWKGKGFCRMGDECRFLHPKHKRGVGSANALEGGSTNSAIIDTTSDGLDQISDELALISPDGKKKSQRRRKNKTASETLLRNVPIAGPTPPGHLVAFGNGANPYNTYVVGTVM